LAPTKRSPGAFQFGGAFIGRADYESTLERRPDYESTLERRPDYESALGSPTSEPDSQSRGFYNACSNFETHPARPKH